ncbi:MAG: hypothetical protein ACK53K_07310 [Burkholderiales bacterium]
MPPTDATIADYFRKGIETGLLLPRQAHSWADSVIAKTNQPPDGFIEVALSHYIPALVSALKEFPGERDQILVARWLLALVMQRHDLQSMAGLEAAIRQAILVSRHCGFNEAAHEFELLDDALCLACHGQYGTVEACRTDFFACLQEHALPFPEAL